jgi:glycosyltransferase involved in cell wall biosynthesis
LSDLDVSVIVPCLDSKRYIGACLEALLAQTFPRDRYEVILVDNGSTDRSVEIAREYARGNPVRVLVEGARRGSYAARNTGVRAARGRILAFTDSDCEVCPTWLERIAAGLAGRGASVLLGARRFARESLVLATLADYEMEKARWVFSQRDARLYYAYTNNMAVTRAAFEQAGPFVEMPRGADVVFVSRVLAVAGCDAVSFDADLMLRHLEIDRFYDWHRKMFLYGRSYRGYKTLSGTRPLGLKARLTILRRNAVRNRYGFARAVLSFASGVAAAAAYEAGRRLGARPGR